MSISSIDSDVYYTDSSSITSNSLSIASSNSFRLKEEDNIFYTPYDEYADTWFQTENKLSLNNYIKQLFTIVRNNLSCNVNANTTKAILVPHAGIKYSGLCAASAYYELTNQSRPIKNVILLCASNLELSSFPGDLNIMAPQFNKISTSTKDKYLDIDTQFISKIKHLIKIDNIIDKSSKTYFQQEHAFFNQIPFLEIIAPNASICPLLIGNIFLDSNTLKKTLLKLQILINLIKDKLSRNDTILICSSNFSYINGNFEKKITYNIFQNIRKLDNETLQFLYNIVDGNETRNSIIDTLLFIKNSSICGIMAIYLFGKILNALQLSYKSHNFSNSPDNVSELYIKYKNKNNNKIFLNLDKEYYSRISCYYSSITREFINITDTQKFDKKTIVPLYEICNTNKSSISYVGLIYTNQPYINTKHNRNIANTLTQYEELALLGLAREQLFYYLMKINNKISIPTNLIKPINAQAFNLELGTFITLKGHDGKLQRCIGTLETGNNEFNIESNVKKYVIDAAIHDIRFIPIKLDEFYNLDINITILYELEPITINQYYTNKFQLGHNGILMKIGYNQGYFLPSVATILGLKHNEKNKLLDELCRNKILGCDMKTAFRKYSNTQLFYNECIQLHF